MKAVYAKLDMTHPAYPAAIAAASAAFRGRLPNNALSINANAAGTMCWIKLVTDDVDAMRDAAAPFLPLILDTAVGDSEHAGKVLADVTTDTWR